MADISNPPVLPALVAPPAVAVGSALGGIQRFAMADHTHASRVRVDIQPITAAGLYTWTFPTPFPAGTVPICNAMAICPSGTTDIVNVQQEGDATATQVTFRVTRFAQSVVALLGLTILSIPGGVPANTKLSLAAISP